MIRIGTSGYSYRHWQNIFYPQNLPVSSWLDFYSQFFDTVELNVTFYRLPSPKIFKNWYQKTPKGFLFALKGSRIISHFKKFQNVSGELEEFFKNVSFLKEKLGVVFWQLPSSFLKDTERLENFIMLSQEIQKRILGRKIKEAFEFRSESWFTKEILEILSQFNCALVIADSPIWPSLEKITADFVYLRFHGGKKLYLSGYSQKELEKWGLKIKKWHNLGLDVFAYFNNDALGYAIENARILKDMVL